MAGRERRFPIFGGIIERTSRIKQSSRTSETTLSKEIHPGSTIKQVSFGIACIEEGPHIARAIKQLTAKQEIPDGTDVLIAISDNGSRGAWQLIEGASKLQAQEKALREHMDPTLADAFSSLTNTQQTLRKLQYQTTQHPTDTEKQQAVEQQLAEARERLTQQLPPEQANQLTQFATAEATYRDNLHLALTDPSTFIRRTDSIRPPFIPSQEPTFWQQETIREYAAILSGKYNTLPQNILIQLASGSEMGNFGSVKETARQVAAMDYEKRHKDVSPKSHIIFIGDMDTHFSEKRLIKGLVEGFSQNPDAPAMRVRVDAAWDRHDKPGEVVPLPLPPELGNLFGDITNFGAFFHEEGRNPKHIVPTSPDISGFFGLPHLLIGPALVFRGDVAAIDVLADQGEDIKASVDLHRRSPRIKLPQQRDARIGFNIRGAQHNPFSLLTDFHTAITPYKHQEWEKALGHDAHMQFRQEIFGYGHRLPLVGEIIRQVEEERYGLQPHEYVDAYTASKSGRFRRKLATEPNREQHLTPVVWDDTTRYYFQARINTLPQSITLQPNEYVARKLSDNEHALKQKKLYRGERIVVHNGEQFLVRTHLEKTDAPQRELFVATT